MPSTPCEDILDRCHEFVIISVLDFSLKPTLLSSEYCIYWRRRRGQEAQRLTRLGLDTVVVSEGTVKV